MKGKRHNVSCREISSSYAGLVVGQTLFNSKHSIYAKLSSKNITRRYSE